MKDFFSIISITNWIELSLIDNPSLILINNLTPTRDKSYLEEKHLEQVIGRFILRIDEGHLNLTVLHLEKQTDRLGAVCDLWLSAEPRVQIKI